MYIPRIGIELRRTMLTGDLLAKQATVYLESPSANGTRLFEIERHGMASLTPIPRRVTRGES
jgi:hypothetical protein